MTAVYIQERGGFAENDFDAVNVDMLHRYPTRNRHQCRYSVALRQVGS